MILDKFLREKILPATLAFGPIMLAPIAGEALAGFVHQKEIERSQICSIDGIASGNVRVRMNNGANVVLPADLFNPDGKDHSAGDYVVRHEEIIQFGGDYKSRQPLHTYRITNIKDQSIAYILLQECSPVS